MIFPVSSVNQLEQHVSQPSDETVEALRSLPGDLMVLGAGGKMGPTLTRMAREVWSRLGKNRRVFAVSRFGDQQARQTLEALGVDILAGDLLDETFVRSLPECENIMFMAGMKFGTQGQQPTTWATNVYLPGLVCEKFAKSRIAAFSTGNIYGLVPVEGNQGSREADAPNPSGEYAMSCLGRERMFQYFSSKNQTPVSILRLNYASELRYGVLVDLAMQVQAETPISLAMGHCNVIWQGDACEMALRSLLHTESPARIFNMTGPEVVSCRDVCERFGKLLDKPVQFTETESETALLNNSHDAYELLGRPQVSLDAMIKGVAHWIDQVGDTWNKPTHFEVRDGKF
ncbi:NAD-dependent epimerase/dehydratase family protein [Adhaeretor mobilis]|uniref:NAD-dependent epimerase/dehydratase domain-containing protein n=1 Tax=Adhaeretor mobilis TaxID=1930276 RepID=A0A517MPV3_9BACT|nr:NAD-dependent epimerase/dehydratase family protein [Adhaeretor mobilis]QDS96910.1 hypothetical protein HG15A2_01690 [Adhaeretor mobilis]